jgi:formate--tetrahydrofolate ligase
MVALLKDALVPNLVRSVEGVPAFVHGGPFANIAHGCNSIVATRMALHTADWAITEAGFGFDLGAEKFLDIKARIAGLDPALVVLVATVRALRMHGGGKADGPPDAAAVAAGLPNLARHLDSAAAFGLRAVVAINQFGTDTAEEMEVIRAFCADRGVPVALSNHFGNGGEGARALAEAVMATAAEPHTPYTPMYTLEASPVEKIRTVARGVYGARDIVLTKEAERDLKEVRRLGLEALPVCIAKVPSSLSDDPTRRGRPEGFDITVRRVQVNAGAGFLVVITGDVMRMPGLPEHPLALDIDYRDGHVVGLR